MSFFNSFRRAFGIGDEYYDEEIQDTEISHPNQIPSTFKTNETSMNQEILKTDNENFAADILESVVELFNSFQPDFIKSCLNTEEQKKYLYNRLDESIKSRIKTSVDSGYKEGMKLWESEKNKLSDELDKLRNEKDEVSKKREESRSALLSAERQKRALNERIRDLENQNAQIQAEIEQLNLENRSLMNKLRVAGISNSSKSTDNDEIEKLNDELTSLRNEYEEFKNTAEIEKNKLEETISNLTTENDKKNALLEEAKNFTTGSDEKDIEIKQLKEKIESLNNDLSEKNNENEKLNQELNKSIEKIKNLENDLETAAYVKEQVDKIEKSIAKKDSQIETAKNTEIKQKERISELENSLVSKDKEIQRLNEELSNLRTTNLKNLESLKELDKLKYAQPIISEQNIKDSGDTPQPSLPSHDKKHNRSSKTKKDRTETNNNIAPKTTPVISAIDELLDSNDWFVAPDASEFIKEPVEDEDFGYKPPVKKTHEDIDDNQLSLW